MGKSKTPSLPDSSGPQRKVCSATKTCAEFALTFMMLHCTLMLYTEVVAKSSQQPAVSFTLPFWLLPPALWNPSTCARSSVQKTLSVASMVPSTDVVDTFSKNQILVAPLCGLSRPTFLSTSLSVSLLT